MSNKEIEGTRKIALVYDAIYPFIKGGAEKRYYELAKELSKKGLEVHLYGMKLWDGPNVIKKEGVFIHGLCRSRSLYKSNGKRSIIQPLMFGISCFKLIREDFDVIDCCGFPYFSLFACKMVTLLKKKPLYSTWHEVWGRQYWKKYLGILGGIGFFIERMAVRVPTIFIAVSNHTAELLKKTFDPRQPIFLVENGIHLKETNAIKPAKEKSDVIFAGRLVDFKHIDILLEAIALLKQENAKISCLIIGDGPAKKRLKSLALQLGLVRNVHFMGFQEEHQKVLSLMKSSRVFVLPSTREGFGMVVLEANAVGLPVVTVDARNNAAQKLIDGKNGQIVKLEPEAIAQSVRKFLQTTGRTYRYTNSVKSYDWKSISLKYEALIS